MSTGRLIELGENVPLDYDINSFIDEEVVQWPIKPDGTHGCWQVSDDTLRDISTKGRVR